MEKSTKFWKWFTDNYKAYTFLASLEQAAKEELLNNLLVQLHKYCDELYFEIGGFPDKQQELIITAEGNKEYFANVEQLIAAAPSIQGWVFIAFKQPTNDPFKSKWGNIELDTNDVAFIPLQSEDPKEIGIRVYVPNYDLIKDDEHCEPLLLKMIDTIAGEKSFAEDVA